jgi:antibiotic biosynthesis monooxygenase (ABM) superfamily enzyme
MTPPPRWKMAIITWIAIYPIITILLLILGPVILGHLPIPAVTLILSVTLVALMTFVVMPVLTRAFRPWLQARPMGRDETAN